MTRTDTDIPKAAILCHTMIQTCMKKIHDLCCVGGALIHFCRLTTPRALHDIETCATGSYLACLLSSAIDHQNKAHDRYL